MWRTFKHNDMLYIIIFKFNDKINLNINLTHRLFSTFRSLPIWDQVGGSHQVEAGAPFSGKNHSSSFFLDSPSKMPLSTRIFVQSYTLQNFIIKKIQVSGSGSRPVRWGTHSQPCQLEIPATFKTAVEWWKLGYYCPDHT